MASESSRRMISSIRDAALTDDEKTAVVKDLGSDLPTEKKEEVARFLFGLRPGDKVRDILYLLVIGALLLILLACAGVLTGIISSPADRDQVLGIFTTVLSFIVGLFVPSPVTPKG